MFESARTKLTLFYLAILLAFSLTLTFSFRVLFEQEYGHSNDAQRTEVHQLFSRNGIFIPGRPYTDFNSLQDDQADILHQRLNRDLIVVNMAALIIGGVLSYWFAGKALEPIEKAHAEQARFTTDASHELRTPLTNLKLENEVFLRQKHFTEGEARELIESNLEEVQRMEGLSTNLLALTQYGHATLKTKPTKIKALVDLAFKQVEKAAEIKQVTIKNEAVDRSVLGNEDSLVQLLVILLDNAIKYGPERGTVLVGGEEQDGNYILWVQDEGPGIAEADMPRIFDRLYRGDKARSSKVGGYGLGLSLAKVIAAANNADIKAQNVPGAKGACFMLRLGLSKIS